MCFDTRFIIFQCLVVNGSITILIQTLPFLYCFAFFYPTPPFFIYLFSFFLFFVFLFLFFLLSFFGSFFPFLFSHVIVHNHAMQIHPIRKFGHAYQIHSMVSC